MTTKTPQHLHEKRGLSFAEYGALLGVRALLANGDMAHTRSTYADSIGSKHLFNMGVACNVNDHCGSVQCIGGAMALIMGVDPDSAHDYVEYGGSVSRHRTEGLNALFYPPQRWSYKLIEPKQAVKAIDNFLAHGHPKWETILRKNQLDAD